MSPSEEYIATRTSPKVLELAEKAKELGVMFHVGGFPFGAPYKTHLKTLGLPKPEPADNGGSVG